MPETGHTRQLAVARRQHDLSSIYSIEFNLRWKQIEWICNWQNDNMRWKFANGSIWIFSFGKKFAFVQSDRRLWLWQEHLDFDEVDELRIHQIGSPLCSSALFACAQFKWVTKEMCMEWPSLRARPRRKEPISHQHQLHVFPFKCFPQQVETLNVPTGWIFMKDGKRNREEKRKRERKMFSPFCDAFELENGINDMRLPFDEKNTGWELTWVECQRWMQLTRRWRWCAMWAACIALGGDASQNGKSVAIIHFWNAIDLHFYYLPNGFRFCALHLYENIYSYQFMHRFVQHWEPSSRSMYENGMLVANDACGDVGDAVNAEL